MRPALQTFPFIFSLLTIFFFFLRDWLQKQLSPNIQSIPLHLWLPVSVRSLHLCGNLSQGYTLEITCWVKPGERKMLSASLIPHPPSAYFPSFRSLSAVRLLLPVKTWSCISSQFYVSPVLEYSILQNRLQCLLLCKKIEMFKSKVYYGIIPRPLYQVPVAAVFTYLHFLNYYFNAAHEPL